MGFESEALRPLGINGLGRIGKLAVWFELKREAFGGFVINLGRGVGTGLEHVLDTLAYDSTYGPIERFLDGLHGKRRMSILDEREGRVEIFGRPVKVLRSARDPRELDWGREGVRLVLDCTGAFLDPSAPTSRPALRGHLEAGAQVVVASAPFKVKDKARGLPEDAAMLIYGINHTLFDPRKHRLISAASCTTTALAHMLKPLLENEATRRILTASMSTVHAATNTQSVLDSVPKDRATDLRKNRAVLDNLILSTTGAAAALEQVLPAIREIGFMADAVRVPTSTVSLIQLNLTFQAGLDEHGDPVLGRAALNRLYQEAAGGPQRDLLVFSDRQNVSSDLKGQLAAVVIEGHENHTRVGFLVVPPEALIAQGLAASAPLRIPVTHAKLFGWYDNEFGSYTHCLCELARHLDRQLG
jgi:glyceraldehyde 3-phosphate dehydrogenase